jgi:hypothetical protein
MGDIGIGIKVNYTELSAAKKTMEGLKLSMDEVKDGSDLTVGTDGKSIEGATKSARLFRNEMEGASTATAKIAKDYDKMIKTATSSIAKNISAGGRAMSGSDPLGRDYNEALRRSGERAGKPGRKTAAEQYFDQHGNYGEVANGEGSGGGGDKMGMLGGALVARLAPYAIAAYGLSKMKQFWSEAGSSTRRITDSQIPLDKLGEHIPLKVLEGLNTRLLMDPLASLGMFNTLAHSGTARGGSMMAAGSAVADRAAATTMMPEETAQKQSEIGQHMQNLTFSSGQSQSDILAGSILKTNTKNIAPRIFDALVRMLSGVGSIRGRNDMTDGQGNRLANLMSSFWEYGSKKNSPFFMGGGIENLYTKAAGSIARGGGDVNSRMFMARALGADKSVTNLESMWAFKSNMEDATNPKNQVAMAKEAMKMAKSLGLKDKEAGAFAKMQLQEAYGGNLTTREIDILMSREYNGMLGQAGTKGGRPVSPPDAKQLADSSEGMVLKAGEGRSDIKGAEGLGQSVINLRRAMNDLSGDFSAAFKNHDQVLKENTDALRAKTPDVGTIDRFKSQRSH